MNTINVGNDLYLKGRIGWRGLSKDEYLVVGDYRIINATSLEDKFIDWNACGYISKDRYEESPEIQLKENDILISKDGTLGKIGYAKLLEKPSTVASGVFVLRNTKKESLNTDYLYHFLKSPIFKDFVYRNKAIGSTINHLYQRDLEELDIALPALEQQNRIASLLNTIDEEIEANNNINSILSEWTKTIFNYWFTQFNFPNPNNRPYKSSGEPMIWSEELEREIPKGWKVGSLLDIAEFINGIACQNYRPTDTNSLKVIKIREIHEGFTKNTELTRADIPSKAIIKDGDVLFSWSASLEIQIWSKGIGALNQHIFKVTSSKYPRSFYYYQLVNYLDHFKMMAESRKTTMGHITQEHLRQSRIVLPPIDLTLKLDKIINPITETIINNEKKIQELIDIRNTLLPMLMNSQITIRI